MKTLRYLLPILLFLFACQEKKIPVHEYTTLYSPDNIPLQSFTIQASTDTILTGKSGTHVRVYKNSFVDDNGNTVTGPISIELKEAFTPLDMVLGNLTTTFNGKVLQSGGMVYLNATSQQKQLSIADSQQIDVSMPATTRHDDMKVFTGVFDSTNRRFNWVDPKDDVGTAFKISAPQRESDSLQFLDTRVQVKDTNSEAAIEQPVKPQQAKRADNRIISFGLDDPAMFPELQQYENVRFRVSESSKLDPADAKKAWTSVSLKKTDKEGVYIVTFGGFDKTGVITRSYEVSPAFEGKDYELAVAEYDKKFEQYELKKKELEEKQKEEEARQKELEAKQQKENARQLALFAQQQKNFVQNRNNGAFNAFQEDPSTRYIFKLKRLGWANIDRLYSDPRTAPADIVTEVDNRNDFETVYITMIFGKQKIYLPGYQKKDGTYGFTHGDYENMSLPIGEQAAILVTAYKGGQPHFIMKNIVIAEQLKVSLRPEPITAEELKEKLEKEI